MNINCLNSQKSKWEEITVEIPEIKIIDSTFINVIDSLILKIELHNKDIFKSSLFAYTMSVIDKESDKEIFFQLLSPQGWDTPNVYFFKVNSALFIIHKDEIISELFCLTGKTEKFVYINSYIKEGSDFVLFELIRDWPIWIFSYKNGIFKLIRTHGVPMSQ